MKKEKFLQMARLLLTPLVMVLLGLLILIRAAQDIVNASRWNCGMRYAIVSALIGAVLIVLPMTTSRLVMVLLGLVVIVLGGLMAWDRLKLGKLLSDGDDGIIDV